MLHKPHLGTSWAGARALVAGGQLVTLLTNTPETIQPIAPSPEQCAGANRFLLPCLIDGGTFEWATQSLLALMFIAVMSGYVPRASGPLHVYATLTMQTFLVTRDGGDQVALVLSILILPLCLADGRLSTWGSATTLPEWTSVSLLAVRVQVAFIYAEAAISKLSQPTWQEGTSVYYWTQGLYFAPNVLIAPPLTALISLPPVLLAATYGAVALELILALTLCLPHELREKLFIPAVTFHILIGVVFGIWSFSIIMIGAALFFLRPEVATSTRNASRAKLPTASI